MLCYVWTVKEYRDEDTTRVIKAPVEHQGSVDTFEEAYQCLEQFVEEVLGVSEPALERHDGTIGHARVSYTLPNGVIINIDEFDMPDGSTEHSAEFELPLPADAPKHLLLAAEEEIVRTAALLGIAQERLSPRSGIKPKVVATPAR